MMMTMVLTKVLAATAATASAPAAVVDCVAGVWSAPPSNAPTGGNAVSNGAYTGNGDLGIVVGAAPVAPTTLAFYMDLMQFRCPTSTGKAKCGYGSGGHAGVGWLGVQVDHAAGERIGFTMQQVVRRAHVSSQSEFSSGVVLNSRAVAFASENLAIVELWYNKTSASAPATLSLDISDEAYSKDSKAGEIMGCRTNKAGQQPSTGHRAGNRADAGASVGPPPWQWVESWLPRPPRTASPPRRLSTHLTSGACRDGHCFRRGVYQSQKRQLQLRRKAW